MPVLRQRPGKGQISNAFVAYKASGIREMAVTDAVGEYPQSTQKPYTDETTHVIFKLLEFIPKLAVLVPKLRVNLTRFHGVFALNSKQRIDVTPVKHGKGRANQENEEKHRNSVTRLEDLKKRFTQFFPKIELKLNEVLELRAEPKASR